ncbi:MAG: hypothetical protein K2N57_01990 [Clostridia bacterium]|nr:hypothetical protein [Clostridia bacterium]
MRKSKLDRLIERNNANRELNSSLLENAKYELRERDARKRRAKAFSWKNFAKIFVSLCCAVIVIVVSIIIYVPTNDGQPTSPPKIENPPLIENPKPNETPSEEKHYAKTENNFHNIQSVDELNRDKNLSLHYFNLFGAEETIFVFEDEENEKDIDVLLKQRILLVETFEEILLYVELQDNYIFDFLERFDNLSQVCNIDGVTIKFDTIFDEDYYLYCTRTTFEIDGFKYRVEFFMEDPEQWISYLGQIL